MSLEQLHPSRMRINFVVGQGFAPSNGGFGSPAQQQPVIGFNRAPNLDQTPAIPGIGTVGTPVRSVLLSATFGLHAWPICVLLHALFTPVTSKPVYPANLNLISNCGTRFQNCARLFLQLALFILFPTPLPACPVTRACDPEAFCLFMDTSQIFHHILQESVI